MLAIPGLTLVASAPTSGVIRSERGRSAPALFVTQNLSEKEDKRKIPLKEFLSFTFPFVLVSLVIQFVLLILVWVLPSAI